MAGGRIDATARIAALRMEIQGSDPATPAAGYRLIYPKSGGWYEKREDGTVQLLAGMANPMTTAGDLIVGGASGTPTRKALGTAYQLLRANSGATDAEWASDFIELAEAAAPATPASGKVRIYVKADGSAYQKDDAGTETGLAGGGGGGGGLHSAYVCIKDEKAAGTSGGTFTNGAWRTRDLNVEHVDTGNHASIASNQITLAAGTWDCRIVAPGFVVQLHQARLRDITGGATLLVGTSADSDASVNSHSWIIGRFTLAVQSVLEVQHRCGVTVATYGFGLAVSYGEIEVYTIAEFYKVV